ncbi:acetyl-CoA C-acetyltransferase [Halobacteriovorax sp. GB3]|uniref:acetyl-CoA C-acetyltransferase n=1 Tax=Halobacteriovorax sp. GB3 TaxID=2719615 RepID=UPI00235FA490|nr:acetyl-CoA C-acetyltransferase [Halobacteriovorax sp. GB3]MDD0853427.1 acetyl-CoA C-acetyltransferase [Halobacteriovorax sp. GB3]
MSKRVCIIDSARIPFCRSGSNYLKKSNLELMSASLKALVEKMNLQGKEVGEVYLGAVSKHAADFSLARECVVESGLSLATPATDIQKACGTSLESAINIANKIALGQIDCGIAGGVDTNSDIPVEFSKKFSDRMAKMNYSRTTGDKLKALKGFSFKELMPKFPAVKEPRTGKSMGQSCEDMAKTWNISREEQDQLAYESHQKASKAYEEGFYDDLIFEYSGVKKDNILRGDTTVEKLSKLRPAFDKSEKGTLTAGNSTPLSDGASCVFLCSEDYAKENGLEVLAYLTFMQSAAVNYMGEEGLLMAPAYAVPKLLKQAGITLQDFDFYEIHEAFAAQVLCTLKAWESEEFCKTKLGLDSALGSIDREKLNVKGGSLAIGHPFAATGSRILGALAKIINEKGSGRGLISICTAGGMGVTAIVEK